MKYIIRPFSEIMIKSKPVRVRYLKILQTNVNLALKKIDTTLKLNFMWDKYELSISKDLYNNFSSLIIETLERIPGIESFIEVAEYDLTSLEKLGSDLVQYYKDILEGKSFVVRVKRSGTHDFKSIDAERFLGGCILKSINNTRVNLHLPEELISIEIKDKKAFLVKNKYEGIGGYPIGTQDKVISLISGGFDSGISTFSLMKRGCRVDYLFFNLGGKNHELGVKEVSNYLRNNFSSGYRAKIITIPFEEVVSYLVQNINHRYRAIILKRLFLRVADIIAKENEYYAIIKGDSLGQVSSQTLKNMFVIDKASDTLVLRPLISFNKQEIINLSKKIGTYEYACSMPEYCAVISDNPATGARLEDILDEEEKFDMRLLHDAINSKKIEFVSEITRDDMGSDIETSYIVGKNDIIIDIREEPIAEANPLLVPNATVLNIPFFDIMYDFDKQDQSKKYLLYCDKGVMSQNFALKLQEKGYNNVGVFKKFDNTYTCKFEK